MHVSKILSALPITIASIVTPTMLETEAKAAITAIVPLRPRGSPKAEPRLDESEKLCRKMVYVLDTNLEATYLSGPEKMRLNGAIETVFKNELDRMVIEEILFTPITGQPYQPYALNADHFSFVVRQANAKLTRPSLPEDSAHGVALVIFGTLLGLGVCALGMAAFRLARSRRIENIPKLATLLKVTGFVTLMAGLGHIYLAWSDIQSVRAPLPESICDPHYIDLNSPDLVKM